MSLDPIALFEMVDEVFRPLAARGYDRFHRFRSYEMTVRSLAEAAKAGNHQIMYVAENRIISGADARRYVWAMSDAIEFAQAMMHLRQLAPEGLESVLLRALDGPADVYDESQRSNAGRNAAFELTIGSLLARAGLEPVFSEHPDVTAEYRGRSILIECKRPFRAGSVPSNIQDAARQLRAAAASGARRAFCAVPAICLSRIMNSGAGLPVFSSWQELHSGFDTWLKSTAERQFEFIRQVRRYGIAGVMFYVGGPAYVLGEQQMSFKQAAYMRIISARADALLLTGFIADVLRGSALPGSK